MNEARALLAYSADDRVGPAAAWKPNTSLDGCLDVIRTVLAKDETYALSLRGSDGPIGCISLEPVDHQLIDAPARVEAGIPLEAGRSGTGSGSPSGAVAWCPRRLASCCAVPSPIFGSSRSGAGMRSAIINLSG